MNFENLRSISFQKNETSLQGGETWGNLADLIQAGGLSGKENLIGELPRLSVESLNSGVGATTPDYGRINLVDFPSRAARLMNRLDVFGQGYLEQDEICRAMQDNSIVGQDAQVLASLHRYFGQLEGLSGKDCGGISKEDLLALTKTVNSPNPTAEQKALLDELKFQVNLSAESQLPSVCHQLYRDAADPTSCISASDIQQGGIGDCYFEATVAALANQSPKSIANMIGIGDYGTYRVTFPGDNTSYSYKVSAPTEAELGLYGHGNRDGVWPTVLEKAFGAYWSERHGLNIGEYEADGADGGGLSSDVMEVLTGHPAQIEQVDSLNDSQLIAKLSAANSRSTNAFITADTRSSDNEITSDGYVANHCYSVLGLSASSENGYSVIVRNPWGSSYKGIPAVRAVPISQFRSNFETVYIGSI